MKKFAKKTVDVGGKSVSVDAQEVANPGGEAALRATATFGSSTVELTHTLAPVDGAHAELDPNHVQNALDNLRQRAARHAILRESLRTQLEQTE